MKEITDFSILTVEKALYVIRSTSDTYRYKHYTFGCSGLRGGKLIDRIYVHSRKGNKTVPRQKFYPFGKLIWALDMDEATIGVGKAEGDLLIALGKCNGFHLEPEGESVFTANSEEDVIEKCRSFAFSLIEQAKNP